MPRLEMNEEPVVAEAPVKKKKISWKVLMAVILIISAAGAGVALWQGRVNGNPGEDEPIPLTYISPMDFTVNLADVGQRRYLKASVAFATNHKNLEKEILDRKPEIRDLVIELFRSRTVTDLNTLTGTEKLREEIKVQVNGRLKTGEILEVYFTEFIIQ
jgi:flagellar protein FliL